MWEGNAWITPVYPDEAIAGLDKVKVFVLEHPEELMPAEKNAMQPLMGLLVTAVEEGLVKNNTLELTRWRDKLCMAFEIGYYVAKGGKFE